MASKKKTDAPKKATVKKKVSKAKSKAKDIKVVVPIPAPIPINIPLDIPLPKLGITDRLKRIKDKVFSTFGLNSPND